MNKNVLIILAIGLYLSGLIFIKYSHNEQTPIISTSRISVEAFTKDLVEIDYEIMYEGKNHECLKPAIHATIKQLTFQKNILEILKHNNLGYLKDSLESRIISIDTNFNVIAINSFPILPQGIKELWDEYINAKIEASEAEEKARNLKILYGE